jgi:hypothetical protein
VTERTRVGLSVPGPHSRWGLSAFDGTKSGARGRHLHNDLLRLGERGSKGCIMLWAASAVMPGRICARSDDLGDWSRLMPSPYRLSPVIAIACATML